MTEHHHGVSPYEVRYGFSRAARVGVTTLVAGNAPVPEPGDHLADGPLAQTHRCGAIAAEAIVAVGGSLADVARTRMFITDARDVDEIGRAHKEIFGLSESAATMVVLAALLDPDRCVEIEVHAIVGPEKRLPSIEISLAGEGAIDPDTVTLPLGNRPTTYSRRKVPRGRHSDSCR